MQLINELKRKLLGSDYYLSVAFFSLFSAWLLAVPFQGQIILARIQEFKIQQPEIPMIYLVMTAHFAGLLLTGFFIHSVKSAKKTILIVFIICILGNITFLIPNPYLWEISLLILAFCAGVFIACWGVYYQKYALQGNRIKTAADVLILSNVGMIFLNVVAYNISAELCIAISTLMLIASMLLFLIQKFEGNNDFCRNTDRNRFVDPNLFKPLMLLCVFIIIITVSSGMMYRVVNPAFGKHVILLSFYWALPYIAAIFIMKKIPSHINKSYGLFVAVAMIGFAYILFFVLDRSALSYIIIDTFLLGSYGICDLFWWSIIGSMLSLSKNPIRVLGIGMSANVMGVILGVIIGEAILKLGSDKISPTMVAVGIVFATLIALPAVYNQLSLVITNHEFLVGLSRQTLGQTPEEKEKTIANNFKGFDLTGREVEIATILLKGETYKMIGEELNISENTVKTHIKN